MARPGQTEKGESMKLGLVTYNLAKDWDLGTIIANCEETGFSGVELRTTHAQIGLALRECGEFGSAQGVEVRLEVHGRVTCQPANIRNIFSWQAIWAWAG